MAKNALFLCFTGKICYILAYIEGEYCVLRLINKSLLLAVTRQFNFKQVCYFDAISRG